MKCRHCHAQLTHTFLDLGSAPPSNAYLTEKSLHKGELWLPLRILVCDHCWLVQTEDFAGRECLFDDDYAYFSSCSSSWLEHARAYVEHVRDRFCLGAQSNVVEIAANDGYLLQYVHAHGIPCLGIEPTASTARAARQKGLMILEEFFGTRLARTLHAQGHAADLLVANNVLAHVPDLNDFVAGCAALLKEKGVASFEFPHLLNMVEHNQFDTAYHEHFSYFSLHTVQTIFKEHALEIFDVQEWPTHGGSLRVFAQKATSNNYPILPSVGKILQKECAAGVTTIDYYLSAQKRAEQAKLQLLSFLIEQKKSGKKVMAYGAAAKGNTLLNFSGVRPDLLSCVVDINEHKQGKFMPGSRIPIVAESVFKETYPDYILMLPWNLKSEIEAQLAYTKIWGARLFRAIPELEIFEDKNDK